MLQDVAIIVGIDNRSGVGMSSILANLNAVLVIRLIVRHTSSLHRASGQMEHNVELSLSSVFVLETSMFWCKDHPSLHREVPPESRIAVDGIQEWFWRR